MKAVGIIVEYNPLHNGHLYHLAESIKLSKAEVVVAVMSGNVVQRGELSMIDKFTKTRWALNAGIDLVIELPGIYTLQNADLFAETSVSLLDKLKVDSLCFGSESGKLSPLLELVRIMDSKEYHERIKYFLNQGLSYPTCSHNALAELTELKEHKTPNNILALQYLRALNRLNSKIEPLTFKRMSSGYYDDVIEGTMIQSATSIRKLIGEDKPIINYVPEYVRQDLLSHKVIDLETLYPYVKYCLSTYDNTELKRVFGFEEGLENRFLSIESFDSINHLIEQIATPRYTLSRIKRTLLHMLIRTLKDSIHDFSIDYIRVLGMSSKGQSYLNSIKHELDIPLITKIPQKRSHILDYELRISKLYSLVANRDVFKDEFQPVIIK